MSSSSQTGLRFLFTTLVLALYRDGKCGYVSSTSMNSPPPMNIAEETRYLKTKGILEMET